MEDLSERIVTDPEVCHGKPTIKGTRLMVYWIVGMLASGETIESLLEEWDYIEREDILACLAYASKAVEQQGSQVRQLVAA